MSGYHFTARTFVPTAFGFAMLLATSVPSYAVSCLVEPAKLSSEELSGFSSNPSSLLSGAAEGGIQLANSTRALAASESDTLALILELSKSATSDQKSAIGTGLARAAQACVEEFPDYAAQIQQAILELDDSVMIAAFDAASEDLATAAIDGADGVVTPAGDGAGGEGGSVATTDTNGGGSSGSGGNGASSASSSSGTDSPSFSGTTSSPAATTTVASPAA